MNEILAHRPWLERFARALARDAMEADDLVQETMVAAWRASPDGTAPLRGWLAVVTRNVHRNRRRDEATRRRWHHAAADTTILCEPPADLLHAHQEAAQTVREMVAALPAEYRDAVHWTYFDERSSSEVARDTGVPAGTTRWRVKVALDLLRKEMDRHFGGREAWQAALLATPTAAPAVSAAGGLAGAKGVAAAKGGAGAFLLTFLLPAAMGVAGIMLPVRHVMRRALDRKERRELMTLGLLSSANVVQFSAVMAWAAPRGARTLELGSFLLLEAAMVALYGFWLPRIIRRRHVVESLHDPESAPRRHARERFWGRFGLVLGSVIGAIGFLQAFLRR